MKGSVGGSTRLVRVWAPCKHRWGQWKQWKGTGGTENDRYRMQRQCARCGSLQQKVFDPAPPRSITPGDGSCDRRHRWSGWTPQPSGQTRTCWGCGAVQTEDLTFDNQQV